MSYSPQMDAQAQKKLRQEAKSLLEQNKVNWIIGHEPGSLKFATTPLITNNAADTSRLTVNPFIVNNLSAFLIHLKGKVGIVAKGCDSRSIVSLIQDNKVKREDLYIIGVPCNGMIDIRKVESLTGHRRDDIKSITRQGDTVTVVIDGKQEELPSNKTLFDKCLDCELPTPTEYDVLLGEAVPSAGVAAESRQLQDKLKSMTPEKRWAYWQEEFSRCIRCYACRNVCPACYCKRCFVEETEPQWLMPMPRTADNQMFQVIRGIHVAGRCTDCGECERACPVGIPLRSMARDMYDIVGELFQYKPGMDKDASPLLTAYEVDEAEGLVH